MVDNFVWKHEKYDVVHTVLALAYFILAIISILSFGRVIIRYVIGRDSDEYEQFAVLAAAKQTCEASELIN